MLTASRSSDTSAGGVHCVLAGAGDFVDTAGWSPSAPGYRKPFKPPGTRRVASRAMCTTLSSASTLSACCMCPRVLSQHRRNTGQQLSGAAVTLIALAGGFGARSFMISAKAAANAGGALWHLMRRP
jgi:hypothetical protein